MIWTVKFGAPYVPTELPSEFQLKEQLADFFEYVRGIASGEIHVLEVRGGVPCTMSLQVDAPGPSLSPVRKGGVE
jgi:hypothetical protein